MMPAPPVLAGVTSRAIAVTGATATGVVSRATGGTTTGTWATARSVGCGKTTGGVAGVGASVAAGVGTLVGGAVGARGVGAVVGGAVGGGATTSVRVGVIGASRSSKVGKSVGVRNVCSSEMAGGSVAAGGSATQVMPESWFGHILTGGA